MFSIISQALLLSCMNPNVDNKSYLLTHLFLEVSLLITHMIKSITDIPVTRTEMVYTMKSTTMSSPAHL